MHLVRTLVDFSYDQIKDALFARTTYDHENPEKGGDPEKAHEWFVRLAKSIHFFGEGVERLLFNCKENYRDPGFRLANAAGFNKDGSIPPTLLHALGLDDVVLGSITGEGNTGKPRPRICRYQPDSMVNWMSLPGKGAEGVRDITAGWGYHGVPLIVNFMETPPKKGQQAIDDTLHTVRVMRELPYIKGWEFNRACPNTGDKPGEDHQQQYRDSVGLMLDALKDEVDIGPYNDKRTFRVKVSPDMSQAEAEHMVHAAAEVRKSNGDLLVTGFTVANTTKVYDPEILQPVPEEGGASGDAVYASSVRVQQYIANIIEKVYPDHGFDIIACGGIKDPEKAQERLTIGNVTGMQVFTPLVMRGPRLLRALRAHEYRH